MSQCDQEDGQEEEKPKSFVALSGAELIRFGIKEAIEGFLDGASDKLASCL